MELSKIITALTVAEHMSFSEAAFELSLSASAVSKQVASLEKELDVRLFERNGKRSVTMTQTGQQLLPLMKKIADDCEALKKKLETMLDSNIRLTLGIPPIYPVDIISELVVAYLTKVPNTTMQEIRCENSVLVDMLYSGKIDVGISTLLGGLADNPEFLHVAQDKNLAAIPLMYQQEYILVNENNPLSAKKFGDLKSLSRIEDLVFLFICRQPGVVSLREKIFLRECQRIGYQPKIKVISMERSTAMHILLQYVASASQYVAFTPSAHNQPGVVSLIHKDNFFDPIPFVYYLKDNCAPSVRIFASVAREISKRHIAR